MGIITNQWREPANVLADLIIPNLKKTQATSDWSAGAISRFFASAKQHGQGMSFITRETDKARMAGLSSNNNASVHYNDIDLAWFAQSGGQLEIYEAGTQKRTNAQLGGTGYADGDVLDIAIEYLEENAINVDDFDDNAIDGAKWVTLSPTANGSIIEQNGRLELRAEPNASGYTTAVGAAINMQGKTLLVDVLPPTWASGATYSSHENYFQIIKGAGQQFFLYFGGGSGLARIHDNGTYYQAGFDPSYVTKFRFRHDAVSGDLSLDVFRSNGTGWQTVLTRPALTYTLDGATHIQLDCGMYANIGVQPFFFVDTIRIVDTGSGWSARYYQTPIATGIRTLKYISDFNVDLLFPNMRIDCSFYHQDATIENVQYLGSGWQDEKGFSKFPTAMLTPAQQYWQKIMTAPIGGGGGVTVPPVTTGQIYPRGIK